MVTIIILPSKCGHIRQCLMLYYLKAQKTNIQMTMIPLSSLPSWQRFQYFPKISLQAIQRIPRLLSLSVRGFLYHFFADSRLLYRGISADLPR